MTDNVTMQRVDEEIRWYDRRAFYNQVAYKLLKIIVIVTAALIPFLSSMPGVEPAYLGALGVLIAIAEGLQQLGQYHANWIAFRANCEALKHEKYLSLAKAGPYANAAEPTALLAERVETIISQETAKWATLRETLEKKQSKPEAA
jgi:Protein of unknown function (DUF4231)